MQTNHSESGTQQLGDAIADAYEVSGAVAPNRVTANELVARHLERVLARGGNSRIAVALRDLADELAPRPARTFRLNRRRGAWAS